MRSAAVKTIALSVGLALSVGSADAAVISSTYAVTGSNFAGIAAPPFTSITESVSITFDTAVLVSEQTSGITLNPSTITPTAPIAFTYNPFSDTLIVGGTNSVVTADPTKTDFALVISNASKGANFGITSLSYTVGTGTTYSARTLAKASPVPEPASFAVFGTALGALAVMRRRRRRDNA